MRRNRRHSSGRNDEGIIIILVAVFTLFVVGAMAALSIDVVTFYTARSEAQLAADGAALAGARVLANSGMTSSTDSTMASNAENIALTVATQVAQANQIGGGAATNIDVKMYPDIACGQGQTPSQQTPCVRVTVTKNDLPTFFARIWGSRTVTVVGVATAEAYNPSGLANVGNANPTAPVAPICVKPWLLPNLNPNSPTNPIFDPQSGAIQDSTLLGWESPNGPGSTRLHARCTTCTPGSMTPQVWQYYPPQFDASFVAPTGSLPACALTNDFQKSIAGCVQTPIACGSQLTVDNTPDAGRDIDAANAVDCLTNTSGGQGDTIAAGVLPPQAFTFVTGRDNPMVVGGTLAPGVDVMVSDSLAIVPVFDTTPFGAGDVSGSVTVIGFVQLFLQPTGQRVSQFGGNAYHVRTKVINMVGCGTGVSGTPVFGNGGSAVPVRLIAGQ